MHSIEKIAEIINDQIGAIYIENTSVNDYSVDFWIPSLNKGVILFEDQHDHPDAYFGRKDAQESLQKSGKEILLLWIEESTPQWVDQHCKPKLISFLHDA